VVVHLPVVVVVVVAVVVVGMLLAPSGDSSPYQRAGQKTHLRRHYRYLVRRKKPS
jgi:hypothetical protein